MVFIGIIILDINVWIVTVIVGDVVFGSVLLKASYMLESCNYRLIIITKLDLIENMLDETILKYLGDFDTGHFKSVIQIKYIKEVDFRLLQTY